MSFQMQTAEPEDSRAVAALAAQTFREAYEGVHTEPDIDRYVAANLSEDWAHTMLADEDFRCVVAVRGSEWLGFYTTRKSVHPFENGENPVELKQLYILRAEYGQGVGAALFDHAIERSQLAGHDRLWLAVSVRNERARAFYAKHDFSELGAGPTFEVGEDRLASTIMERRL